MPSMDGPGNWKMFEKFTGNAIGEWKVSDNTRVRGGNDSRSILLHGNCIADWRDDQLQLCACGWATQTTMRKLNYLCQHLHDYTMIPFRLIWGIEKGNVVLGKWNTETGEWDKAALPVNEWSVWIECVAELTPGRMNYDARLDARTAALFLHAPQPLPVFKPLTFNQMKGVL